MRSPHSLHELPKHWSNYCVCACVRVFLMNNHHLTVCWITAKQRCCGLIKSDRCGYTLNKKKKLFCCSTSSWAGHRTQTPAVLILWAQIEKHADVFGSWKCIFVLIRLGLKFLSSVSKQTHCFSTNEQFPLLSFCPAPSHQPLLTFTRSTENLHACNLNANTALISWSWTHVCVCVSVWLFTKKYSNTGRLFIWLKSKTHICIHPLWHRVRSVECGGKHHTDCLLLSARFHSAACHRLVIRKSLRSIYRSRGS